MPDRSPSPPRLSQEPKPAAFDLETDGTEAVELIKRVARVVHRVYPEVPSDILTQLPSQAVTWVGDGTAGSIGLQLRNLCHKIVQAERGDAPERDARTLLRETVAFEREVIAQFGQSWQQACELMVRTLCATAGQGVAWECLASVPTATHPRYLKSLGVDKPPGMAPSMRFLTVQLGNANRCVIASSKVNTRGTRDDHSYSRYDKHRVAQFERECGVPIAGTVGEHTNLALRQTASIRSRIESARKASRISARDQATLEKGFSQRVILPAQRAGVSCARGVWYSFMDFPGDDPDTIAQLTADGRHGVALCSPETLAAADEQVPPEQWDLLRIEPDELARTHALKLEPLGTAFRHLEDQGLLVREVVGETGHHAAAWKLLPGNEDISEAAALITIAEEKLPRECVERARAQDGWGKLSVRKVAIHAAMRHTSHVADGSLVTAERLRLRDELLGADYS